MSDHPEDVIEVVVIDGRVRCIYVNDFRVAGSKPYVSEPQKMERFAVENGMIRKQLKKRRAAK